MPRRPPEGHLAQREAVAVLGAGGTIGFAIARRLGQATAEHGDEDVSAIYLTSAPEHTH